MLGGRGEYVRVHRAVVANTKTALHKRNGSRGPMAAGSPGGGEKRGQRWRWALFGDRGSARLWIAVRPVIASSEFGATRIALVGIVLDVIDAKAAKCPSGRNAEQQKRNRRSNQHDWDDQEVTD